MAKRKQKLTKNEKLGARVAKACATLEEVEDVLRKKRDAVVDSNRGDQLETIYNVAANLISNANELLDNACDLLTVAAEIR